MNGYATARQNGWMSANDIRELENLDRIPADEGGDLYLINGNMTKLEDAGIFAASAPKETEESGETQEGQTKESREQSESDTRLRERRKSLMTRKFWRWVQNETPDSFGSDRTLYLDGEISDETWYGDEVTPQALQERA
jgi:hypothetical protein